MRVRVEDGAFLGGGSLHEINAHSRVASLSYWIWTSQTGKGLATSAARPAIRLCLEQAGLERIRLVTGIDNMPSLRNPGRPLRSILREVRRYLLACADALGILGPSPTWRSWTHGFAAGASLPLGRGEERLGCCRPGRHGVRADAPWSAPESAHDPWRVGGQKPWPGRRSPGSSQQRDGTSTSQTRAATAWTIPLRTEPPWYVTRRRGGGGGEGARAPSPSGEGKECGVQPERNGK